MSSGATHDKINGLITLAILAAGITTGNPNVVAISAGLAIGTMFLSPDLDLKQSLPSKRLGLFKFLFAPYRKLCSRHRSLVSHSPVLSTLIRFVYVSTIPLLIAVYLGHQETVRIILNHPLFVWGYLGLEFSCEIHLFLDLQYSFRKKHLSL